jgi:ABC-type amino acid transport substrate-binding protein
MLEGEEYTGYGPDLLVRLSELALEDDVLLTFDMTNAISTPAQYATALDLIANDCVPTNLTGPGCDTYDIIIGDYYVNNDRALRVQFTPAWLHTRITGVRGEDGKYDSFTAANEAGGKVCVPQGTLLPDLLKQKYPNVDRVLCPSPAFCVDSTKTGDCDLYADDELLLRYRASQDATLVLSSEGFGTQYISW